MTRLPSGLALAAALIGHGAPASAHPHVFVDSDVAFRLGQARKLQALRVRWVFDELYSMLLLNEMGIDPAAPLDEAERAALSALQPDWAQEFGGEGVARHDEAEIALKPAEAVSAGIEDGRLVIAFDRPLERPVDLSEGVVRVEVFDPTFYVAYTMLDTLRVEGPGLETGAERCSAMVRPFAPSAETDALQATLLDVAMDQTPATPQVGRIFADSAVLTCR